MTEYVSDCCEGKVRIEPSEDGWYCLTCGKPCEAICDECHGTGLVDIETGGGNTRGGYCDCCEGSQRQEQDEEAKDAYWDRQVDRMHDDRIEDALMNRKR